MSVQTKASARPHLILATAIASLITTSAWGANITLRGNDPNGTNSFSGSVASPNGWSDSAAPSSANDYFTGAFQLRTPTGTTAAKFQGKSLSIDAGGSLLFKGSGVYTVDNLILNGGSLIQGDVSATPNTATLDGLSITVAAASTIDTTPNTGRNFIIKSAIHGTAGLTIQGTSGTVTFTNTANDFTGPLTLAGTSPLIIGALANGGVASALGKATNAPGNLVLDGGTLRVNGTTASSTDRLFSLNTTGGTIESADGTAPISFTNTGAIGLNGTGARTFTLTGTSTGTNTFTPAIGDNGGATTLTKSGTGTWVLTGTSTYTGATNITAGTLVISSNSNLGNGTAVNLSAATTLRWATGGTADLTGRILTLTTGTANLDTNGQNITLASSITGTGTLKKLGNGVLTLSGANSFTGNVDIRNNSGAVRITNSSALGVGPKTVFIRGNTGGANTPSLRINGSSGSVQLPASISFETSNDVVDAEGTIVSEAGNNTINGKITMTIDGGGTRLTSKAGTLTFNGEIGANTGGRTVTLSGAGAGIVNGIVSAANSPALTKEGAGTWVLNGANTYTGATAVKGGMLVATTASAATGAVTVDNTATLGVRVNAPGQTYTVPSLTSKTGSGLSLDLGNLGTPTTSVVTAATFAPGDAGGVKTVNITFSGTNLTAGTTIPLIDYTGTIGGGGFAALNLVLPPRAEGTLVENTTNTTVDLNLTKFDYPRWTGATDGKWDTASENWKEVNSGNTTAYIQGANGSDGVLFDDNATGTTNIDLTTTLTPSGVTVNNSTKNYTFSGVGKLSGTASLTKQGTGTLVLTNTGANDYAGITTISAGTVQVGDGTTVGAGQLGNGPVVNNGALIFSRPDDVTVSNPISGSGVVTKNGTNTLTLLNPSSTFGGALIVNQGTLRIEGGASVGGSDGTIQVGAAGTLSLFHSTTAISKAVEFQGGKLTVGAGTANAIGGAVMLSAASTIDTAAGATVAITGPISGASFTKTGAGIVELGGTTANTYTGTTTVSAGTLRLNKTAGTPAIAGEVVVNNGGVLSMAAANQFAAGMSVTINNTGTWTNSSNAAQSLANLTVNSTTTSSFNNLNITGLFSITAGAQDISSSQATTANALSISNNGSLRLGANTGTSTLNIGAGGLTLANGTLQLGQAGGTNITAQVNLSGNLKASGTSQISNPNTSGPRVVDLQGQTRTFEITDGTTIVSPFIQNGGLEKTGLGTLVLNGANTYIGVTMVDSGTLVVGGSIAGATVVESGGTLGGTGILNGNVTIQGTLQPGGVSNSSIGTLTLGNSNLTLESGATATFDIGGIDFGTFDRVAGVNTLTLGGTINLTLAAGFTPALGNTFDLFDAVSINASAFNIGTNLVLPALGQDLSWDTSNFASSGVLAVVPEPGTAMMLVSAASVLLGGRRFRRRTQA